MGFVFRLPETNSHGYVLGPPLPEVVNAAGKPYVELLVDESHMYHYADFPGMLADGGVPGGARGSHAISLNAPGLDAVGRHHRHSAALLRTDG